MRITEEQVLAFHTVLKEIFGTIQYELYLYGSRTRDDLKGGDIDLLILTTPEGVELFAKMNLDILVQIKKNKSIGQRRIDLKAYKKADLHQDAFLKHIKGSLVRLG